MASDIISRLISALKEEKSIHERAGWIGDYPEPYRHGVQVGMVRGLDRAEELLSNIIQDVQEKEILK